MAELKERAEKRAVGPPLTGKAAVLDNLVDVALEEALYILKLPRDPAQLEPLGLDPMKVASLKGRMVEHVDNLKVKADIAALQHGENTDLIDLMREELRAIHRPEKQGAIIDSSTKKDC